MSENQIVNVASQQHKIAILLSTFNGSLFIREQLDSLISQSHHDFHIYIRDDGSSDDTLEIIKRYAINDQRIQIVQSNGNVGVINSFLLLCEAVDADFYFFCDQDDVWFENKVEETLNLFKGRQYDLPLLVHTDLVITDTELNIISMSFYEHTGVSIPSKLTSNQILLQNFVVGCSMAINKALRNELIQCLGDTHKMYMHDWWAALIATYKGEIISSTKPLIYYRQHGKNQCGAQKRNLFVVFLQLFDKKHLSRFTSNRNKIYYQVDLFKRKFGYSLDSESLELVDQLIDFKKNAFWGRIVQLISGQYPKSTFLNRLFDLFFIRRV